MTNFYGQYIGFGGGTAAVGLTWFGDRGVFAGGDPGDSTIDYIQMDSGKSATDFAELSVGRYLYDSCSDGSRGVWAGGYNNPPGNRNIIDYIAIGYLGDALDFGDLTDTKNYIPGCAGG